jgi:hypothetical protein
MKPMGDAIILQSKTATTVECLYYAMNLPTFVVITACDSMQMLQQAIDAARSFRPMDKDQVSRLLAKMACGSKGRIRAAQNDPQFRRNFP